MSMKYSPTTKGFYIEDFHVDIPVDAVSITDEEHMLLLAASNNGLTTIGMNSENKPVVIDRPQDNDLILRNTTKLRDTILQSTDWLLLRNNDQITLGVIPTLTPTEITELMMYRQTLRDLPSNPAWPDKSIFPIKPSFI